MVNEQHFWASLCEELGLGAVAALGFDERCRRGAELQQAVADAIARPSPVTDWWPASSPPASRSRPCSTARGCWPRRRSPDSRSGFPSPRPHGPSRHSTSTAARASRSPAEADGRAPVLLRSSGRMTRISDLLQANQAYAAARANVADPRPGRHLAVVTCMDARIDVFAVLGLHLGEAHVIRNAGGRVTEDVLRSLALSSGVLGVDTAVVMQHTKCGLVGVSDAQLREMTGRRPGVPADRRPCRRVARGRGPAGPDALPLPAPADRRVGLRRRERAARRRGALGATGLRRRARPGESPSAAV